MTENNFTDKIKKVILILTPLILIAIIFLLIFKYDNTCNECNKLEKKIDSLEHNILNNNCLDCN